MPFSAPPAGALLAEPLDGGIVALFHRPSGTTHLVAEPAPEILAILAEQPLDRAMLMARLAERFDLGDAEPGALDARLDELVAAGLVDPG